MSNPKTLLIIDDEEDLRDTVAYKFKAKGFNVVTAVDGLDGLEKLETVKPDLIILDMNMPKMGGIEFYRNISDTQGKTRYPVLILTARANLEQLFKDLNVDGFMTKPFELDNLLEEVNIIITKRQGKVEAEKPKVKDKPKKVLVVEDNKDVFDKIAIAFLNAGYLVSCAKSGLATIDKIMVDMPDLIVIKLGLSDLPGDLVIAKLKQMPKTMDIACVLYTPENDRLNYSVTDKICENIGIRKLVESDKPRDLLNEAEHALQDK